MTYLKPTPKQRMTELAATFPCLRDNPAIDPFEPAHLDEWAAGVASRGEAVTARFLLAVWAGGSSSEWASEPFCMMEALKVWDGRHREAFLTWAGNPWWP